LKKNKIKYNGSLKDYDGTLRNGYLFLASGNEFTIAHIIRIWKP